MSYSQASHSLHIHAAEFYGRSQTLLQYIHDHNLTGVVLFDSTNILYFTGFAFIPTERPIAFALSASGERALFVPRLEVEHAKSMTAMDRVAHYPEYPGELHPMQHFRQMLVEMEMLSATAPLNEQGEQGLHPSFLPNYLEQAMRSPLQQSLGPSLGADQDGYPWILGYEGPSLSQLTAMTIVNVQGQINRMQAIKSAAELALIRESCKWGHLAHVLLQRYTAVYVTETYASQRASMEATLTMMDAIGPLYRAQSMWSSGPSAGYRGQIGRNAAIPHALANNIVFQPGDVLVTGAGCPMWGYHSELERTMFVGKPTARQQALFAHMLAAQEIAFAIMKPGVTCAAVDTAVRAYYERHNLTSYWKHHTGHAIGLRYHEGPFLDTGDNTVLQPGMVFTIEPGFYASELGGFRHSDTVAVTEDGLEIMTYYPRAWEQLVIPV
ncbi:MAG: aminopeptidase P family protein [Ardenticatenaceae bacterium]|nr:aminopeptidase P family protein [Ardenticatenaceae bacterium]